MLNKQAKRICKGLRMSVDAMIRLIWGQAPIMFRLKMSGSP